MFRQSVGAEVRIAQQAYVVRGNTHHHGGVRQQRPNERHVETGTEQDLGAVEHGAVKGHEESVDVEDGQDVQQHVARFEAPELVQRSTVHEERTVGEHRPLRTPGGT